MILFYKFKPQFREIPIILYLPAVLLVKISAVTNGLTNVLVFDIGCFSGQSFQRHMTSRSIGLEMFSTRKNTKDALIEPNSYRKYVLASLVLICQFRSVS